MAQEKRRFLNTQQAKVAFKGVGQDVHVILDPRTAFGEIERELEEHLERSGKFFTGAAVTLVVGTRKLRDEHLQRIRQVLATHGLTIGEIRTSAGDSTPAASPPRPPSIHLQQTHRYRRDAKRFRRIGRSLVTMPCSLRVPCGRGSASMPKPIWWCSAM